MDSVILEAVAQAYGVTVTDILSKNRKGKLPEASRMATLFLKSPSQNPEKIASSIKRERTAVYNNVKQITFEIARYPDVRQKFKTIHNAMIQYLENLIKDLESWLINNPCFDGKIREQKLDRLADAQETLEYINNLKIN